MDNVTSSIDLRVTMSAWEILRDGATIKHLSCGNTEPVYGRAGLPTLVDVMVAAALHENRCDK